MTGPRGQQERATAGVSSLGQECSKHKGADAPVRAEEKKKHPKRDTPFAWFQVFRLHRGPLYPGAIRVHYQTKHIC